MPRRGTKSRAEKVEETHALTAANMFLELARSTPGLLHQKSLENEIDALSNKVMVENPNARITAWKRHSVINIVLCIPDDVLTLLMQHYRIYTWERSCLNEELLQDPLWRPGQVLNKTKGEWCVIFTTSEESVLSMAHKNP